MHSPFNKLSGAAVALALCASPTVASAATPGPVQPINPLVAVSAFGTQASAQAVSAQTASATAAATAAVAAQDDPATQGDFGINWILAGLGAFFFLAGIYTLFADDDDDHEFVPISPA